MGGRDDQIATRAKLFDNTHNSYGFSGDMLQRLLPNEYQCGKASFSGGVCKLCCLSSVCTYSWRITIPDHHIYKAIDAKN